MMALQADAAAPRPGATRRPLARWLRRRAPRALAGAPDPRDAPDASGALSRRMRRPPGKATAGARLSYAPGSRPEARPRPDFMRTARSSRRGPCKDLPQVADGSGTIELIAEPPVWLPFARWTKVSITIDGALSRLPWGEHAFRVEPGEHTVVVRMGTSSSYRGTITISVAPNAVVRLRFRPRFFNLEGGLAVDPLPLARVVTRWPTR